MGLDLRSSAEKYIHLLIRKQISYHPASKFLEFDGMEIDLKQSGAKLLLFIFRLYKKSLFYDNFSLSRVTIYIKYNLKMREKSYFA